MARRYWPGQDPVGRHFRIVKVHEVIGVCRDVQGVKYMEDDGPFYYWPLDLEQLKPAYMMVRVSGDAEAVSASVREIVRQTDPQMATTISTLASIVRRQGEQLKPMMMYGAVSGVLALLLALTGVYAVVSFSVSQRVREIGIRTALGAQRRDVVSLFLRSGAAPVLGGLVTGLGLVFALSALMASLLYGFNPRDPLTLGIVPLLLFAAALSAIWIPARRAAALDPLTSLRRE
jgi:ABC-type antimicrobial peptide transport system permease subunit